MSGSFDCSASCPGFEGRNPTFDFPVGQVRRVAATEPEVDETKRNILKLAAVAGVLGVGVGGVVGGLSSTSNPRRSALRATPAPNCLTRTGRR